MRQSAPVPADVSQSCRAYPGSRDQITIVSADLRALLGDCPAADDVVLCASELATNAVVHSASREPGGMFTIRADIRPGIHVRIEVADQGGIWITRADPERPHGLDVVRALASTTGIEGGPQGRVIWFVLTWKTP